MAQSLVGWKNDPFNSNPLSFSTTWSKYIVFQVKADQLTFPKTSRHHSGVYTCSADNGWGSAAQARIVLDVQVKRAIMIRLTMVYVGAQLMHKDYLKAWSRIFLFPAQTRDWAGGNIHPHKVSRPLRYFGLTPRTLVSNCSSNRDGDDVEITCTVHASPAAEVSEQFEENQDFLWLAHQRIQVFKLMLIGWNKKI